MDQNSAALFHFIPDDARARIFSRLKRQRFEAGAVVIAEGDERKQIYVIDSGSARVTVDDRHGIEHTVNQVGPGDTLGEMSFLTGLPASATVIAITQLDVVVIGGDEFGGIALEFPQLPGIYPPQLVGSRLLVDGGVANPVPSDIAADMGADVVLAVKLRNQGNGHPRNGVEVLLRAFDTMQDQIMTSADGAETILIEPAFSRKKQSSLLSFVDGRCFIELGEEAAREALPRLKSAIPWLRSES